MPANIKNNNTRALGLMLYNDEYWDYMLFKGEEAASDGSSHKIVDINIENPACLENGKLYSSAVWNDAVNEGVTLKDIGLTGMDNGVIKFDIDTITPLEFIELFTGSTLALESGDTRFFLSQVTGNTKMYTYPLELVSGETESYLKLTGGFYQGFFKLDGFNYQTLPYYIDSDWHFEFVLRKRPDYAIPDYTVNKKYPENKGIFFYIGTRAENKFAEIYNGLYDNYKSVEGLKDCDHQIRYEKYCSDLYLGQYIRGDLSSSTANLLEDIETSDGLTDKAGMQTFLTDNKYLFFNRTDTGFTIDTWNSGNTAVQFSIENREYVDNPYLLYNRTKSGHTIDDYSGITVPSGDNLIDGKYNMGQDLISNAFALQMNDDGSITYRYMVRDCDAESGLTVLSETTLSGLVKDNEWSTVNLRCISLGKNTPCKTRGKKMKLYIYVNGYLVFVSKELPLFNFRALNDDSTKQEGVAYNISIGGGSQGLAERFWQNYLEKPKYVYEIEKNYMGSFVGDLKSFKMYDSMLHLKEIKENHKNN